MRSYQAHYARLFEEFLDRLEVSRRVRKHDGLADEMAEALARLFAKHNNSPGEVD